MEPFETVEANNQLVQFAEDEAAEIARILRELTERLQVIRGPLQAAAATIAELDSVFARARFARDFDAATPEFSNADELQLVDARHPVLEERDDAHPPAAIHRHRKIPAWPRQNRVQIVLEQKRCPILRSLPLLL